jgi:fucose 4-O-acetylase-like acetyltransferase
MVLYPIVIVIHILSAVTWLSFLPVDYILRKNIRETEDINVKKKLISVWLKTSNLLGIAGMSGILVTGIIMVSVSSDYHFFQFSMNHWLATKQVFMVVLIVITFVFLIPNAKTLTAKIENDLQGETTLNENINQNIDKISKILSVMNVLVLINFLLAITHRFI